tara:strand:- start:227 stop:568 length:342 start_codon:yes stop_codon:yes gene_type:complete
MSKQIDLNRQRKIYPLLRQKPVIGSATVGSGGGGGGGGGGSCINAETHIIPFNNTHSVTKNFTGNYTTLPVVAVTPEDENVNLFITNLGLNSVTIESSAPFTGNVHLQVFEDN